MSKGWQVLLVVSLALAAKPTPAATLTDTERAWLAAAAPVLAFARQQQLPLDILVQPQPTPGQTPLGLAFIEGRCTLVLSMRGNPEAQATLDRVAPDLLGPVVEAIAAHELAHCWRHLRQAWGTLPGGLQEISGFSRVSDEQAALLRDMWRTRREEAFADLVGLAWTLQQHPARYAEVHAWHVALRADQAVDTGPHDTRKWVRLAADRAAFGPAASIFEQAQPIWQAGLLEGG
jgi:hypothetical protein